MPVHVTSVKGIGEIESAVMWSSVFAKITKNEEDVGKKGAHSRVLKYTQSSKGQDLEHLVSEALI